MQAIVTKYLRPTNTKGARIKAQCARGSLTLAWNHSLPLEENHILAAHALKDDFVAQDAAKYGSVSNSNHWAKPIVSGCLPSGNYAHVFVRSMNPHSKLVASLEAILSHIPDQCPGTGGNALLFADARAALSEAKGAPA